MNKEKLRLCLWIVAGVSMACFLAAVVVGRSG